MSTTFEQAGNLLKVRLHEDGSWGIESPNNFCGLPEELSGSYLRGKAIPSVLSLNPVWNNKWYGHYDEMALTEGWKAIGASMDRETESRRHIWEPVLSSANGELPRLRKRVLNQFNSWQSRLPLVDNPPTEGWMASRLTPNQIWRHLYRGDQILWSRQQVGQSTYAVVN